MAECTGYVLIDDEKIPGFPRIWSNTKEPYEDIENQLIKVLKENCRDPRDYVVLGYKCGRVMRRHKNGDFAVYEAWFADEDALRVLNIPSMTDGWETMVKPTPDGVEYLEQYLKNVENGDPLEWAWHPCHPLETPPKWWKDNRKQAATKLAHA